MLSSFLRNKFLFFAVAQGEPNYFEVGTTLTLEPDVSAVPQPITTIRWKYGTNLVVDWIPSCSVYYGSFKGRTTFVPETMRLVINRLTLVDSGQFSLETNRGIHVTYEVKVISKCVCVCVVHVLLCVCVSVGVSHKVSLTLSQYNKVNRIGLYCPLGDGILGRISHLLLSFRNYMKSTFKNIYFKCFMFFHYKRLMSEYLP